MSATEHFNLDLIPTGAVEWPALVNANTNKIEVGRTVKRVAGETLVKGDPFYIYPESSIQAAYKANNETPIHGIWQSASTANGAEGYGQISGIMTIVSWSWTEGAYLYITSVGALTETAPLRNSQPVAWALSATEIVLLPSIPIESGLFYETLTTSNDTPTALFTRALTEAKSYLITIHVTAKEGDILNVASYVQRATVYRQTGGSAILDNNEEQYSSQSSSLAWGCVIDVSGNNVRVMVTGESATTIDWRAKIELIEV